MDETIRWKPDRELYNEGISCNYGNSSLKVGQPGLQASWCDATGFNSMSYEIILPKTLIENAIKEQGKQYQKENKRISTLLGKDIVMSLW